MRMRRCVCVDMSRGRMVVRVRLAGVVAWVLAGVLAGIWTYRAQSTRQA